MIKKILVGLGDEQYSRVATDHAIDLAKRHDASLTGVTLFDPHSLSAGPVPIGAGESARELREHRVEQTERIIQQAIEYFEQSAKSANIEHNVVREEGDSFTCMISNSRYYDLIVCGLRNLFTHGVVEDPPHELVRLVEGGVRPLIAVGSEYREIRRVLMAYSGSTESAKAMKRFVQQRIWPGVRIRIVSFGPDDEDTARRLADAADYCESHGLSPETESVDQPPKTALLTYAAGWDADLIVMGNSAKRLTLRRIFGETVLHVVANSNLPLYLSQ